MVEIEPLSGGGAALSVLVRPGARKTRIAGEKGGYLVVEVAAKAEGGRANSALLAFLARVFGVEPEKVKLAHGARSRRKKVLIQLDQKRLAGIIASLLERDDRA